MQKYKALVDRPYGAWTLDEDELKRFKFWMTYDPIHEPEPLTPLVGTIWSYWHQQGYVHAAERTSLPPSKGCSVRMSPNGYMALSENPAPTPEEMGQRGAQFGKFMGPFLERFEGLWGDFRHKGKVGDYLRELQGHLARLGSYDLETWTFDLAKYKAKLEKLIDNDLYDHFQDTAETGRRLWEIHFEVMYVVFSIYMTFEGTTMELFGFADTDPRFQKLIQGFDNHVYDCDRRLWHLAHLAVGLGLSDTFTSLPETAVIPRLKQTDNGRKWVSQLDEFLLVDGIRCANPFDYYKVRWSEDPSAVVAIVRDYIRKGLIDYDAERRKIVDEREKTVAETMAKVPEARKQEFRSLLKLAQIAYCWNEDHNYWIEQAGGSTMRPVILEMGKRLHKGGAIAEPNDIFFINWEELRATFALGVLGKYDFRDFVAQRKAVWKAAFAKVPPKVTGDWVREEVRDPIYIKIFGLGPMAVPVEKVDVFGYPGAPGVVEGIARVITAIDNIGSVETGAILVTGATGPAWTPVFSRIKGVVTDHGGALTHAAIVSREYGIPAVVGTGDATIKIKDGQRIRVDGNRGLVSILR
jgi:pyruvate,water dikinase